METKQNLKTGDQYMSPVLTDALRLMRAATIAARPAPGGQEGLSGKPGVESSPRDLLDRAYSLLSNSATIASSPFGERHTDQLEPWELDRNFREVLRTFLQEPLEGTEEEWAQALSEKIALLAQLDGLTDVADVHDISYPAEFSPDLLKLLNKHSSSLLTAEETARLRERLVNELSWEENAYAGVSPLKRASYGKAFATLGALMLESPDTTDRAVGIELLWRACDHLDGLRHDRHAAPALASPETIESSGFKEGIEGYLATFHMLAATSLARAIESRRGKATEQQGGDPNLRLPVSLSRASFKLIGRAAQPAGEQRAAA